MLTGSIPARDLARILRRKMTPPEVLLWKQLRLRPDGLKFRRQHPVGDYVLDFFCPAARLAIEIDGWVHQSDGQGEFDRRRDVWLGVNAVRILRFSGEDVLRRIGEVVLAIVTACGEYSQPPLHHAAEEAARSPSPKAGRIQEERPWTI